MLLSTYYAATASDLIADINAANTAGGANTIVLTAPTTSPYVLTAVNNTTDGATVLPVIAFKKHDHVTPDTLTILTGNRTTNPGYGETIDASRVGRLFDVASGNSLSLQNVTLQNGLAFGSGIAAEGGAVYNQGTLMLSEVMIQNNTARGFDGSSGPTKKATYPAQDAAGGGIWSNGSLTVENSTEIQKNSAVGGAGGNGMSGANAFGGGIYIAGGTANITGSTFGNYSFGSAYWGNTAQGGEARSYTDRGGSAYGGAVYVSSGTVTMSHDGVYGNQANNALGSQGSLGTGYGGGLYVASGSVTLTNDTVIGNAAGYSVTNSVPELNGYTPGYGGGIFIASGAKVYLDSFTVANTFWNSAANGFPNIDGTYILLP